MPKLRSEMLTTDYGFIVDYLAKVLRSLRNQDYSYAYREYFELNESMTAHDKDGVQKTLSGLIKLIYPDGNCPTDELESLLRFAMEGRRRVKAQLVHIDETFEPVAFFCVDRRTGERHEVETLEVKQYGHLIPEDPEAEEESEAALHAETTPPAQLEEQHIVVQENQRGISYRSLFGDYVRGARAITVIDPYLHQEVRSCKSFEITYVKLNVQ